jgi:hypothetical protein
LRDFADVYIALDREFDDEATDVRPAADAWLHLGYDWLEASASRAEMHVQRGNSAARLVVSYCNRQTDWTSAEEEEGTRLAAELCQEHPDAVSHLIGFSRGRVERNWLTRQALPDSTLLFLLQNKGAIAILKETQGMAAVKAAVRQGFEQYDSTRKTVDTNVAALTALIENAKKEAGLSKQNRTAFLA